MRYATLAELRAALCVLTGAEFPASELRPSYNVAPTQQVLVACDEHDGKRETVVMRWGLIPSSATRSSAMTL